MPTIKPKTVVDMKVKGVAKSHARTNVSVRDLEIIVDEPEARGGTNLGATPTETIAVALAGCLNVVGHRCAEKVGLTIINMEININAKFDRRGVTFEKEGIMPFPEINVNIDLTTKDDEEKIEAMKSLLAKHCPISTLLRHAGTNLTENWNIIRP